MRRAVLTPNRGRGTYGCRHSFKLDCWARQIAEPREGDRFRFSPGVGRSRALLDEAGLFWFELHSNVSGPGPRVLSHEHALGLGHWERIRETGQRNAGTVWHTCSDGCPGHVLCYQKACSSSAAPCAPGKSWPPTTSPRRSIRMNDRERDRERVYSHAGALAGTGEVVLRGRRGHSLIAPTPPRRPACHRFGAAEKGEGGGVSWGPSAPGGEFSG